MSQTTTPDASEAPADDRAKRRAEQRATRLARRIEAFAKAHGGAEGTLEYLGQAGTRIVLVGADGAWGDLVAPRQPIAERAAELSGITVHDDFGGEFAARVRTGRYEWRRMAGIQAPTRGPAPLRPHQAAADAAGAEEAGAEEPGTEGDGQSG